MRPDINRASQGSAPTRMSAGCSTRTQQHRRSNLAFVRKKLGRACVALLALTLWLAAFAANGRGQDEKLLAKEPYCVVLDKHGGGAIFSPDGKSLACDDYRTGKDKSGITTYSGIVRIWDISSRKSSVLAEWGKPISLTAFSPDGTLLAGCTNEETEDALKWSNRIIILWKVKTGERVAILKSDRLVGLSDGLFSPNGKILMAGAAEARVLEPQMLHTFWEIPSGKLLRTIKLGKKNNLGHDQLSPDGKTLALSGYPKSEYGKTESILVVPSFVHLWDVATGKMLTEFKGMKGPIYSLALSPDGRLLAVGGNIGSEINEIIIWDVVKKERYAVLRAHRGAVMQVTFSHDGKWLASAGGGEHAGEVWIWDVKKKRELVSLQGHTKKVSSVCFSPDDSLLATSEPHTVRLWYLRQSAKGKTDR